MAVCNLGYLVIGAADIDAWRRYAGHVLGAQVDEDGAQGLRLRIDDRAWRIGIEPSPVDDILAAGWEVAGRAAMETIAVGLREAGVEVAEDAALAMRRDVSGLMRFIDPAGVACELFWGPRTRFEQPFVSPVGVSGFKTGDEGLGHIVLAAADPAAMEIFYRDRLGFRLSDYIDIKAGPRERITVTFMHCNPRHHSVAFAPAPPTKKLLHFMLETNRLDDVGLAQDRAAKAPGGLALTLGRHSNDLMLSFYAYTPSGFEVEYGWGARSIDDATWTPERHDQTSIWGHAFVGHGSEPA